MQQSPRRHPRLAGPSAMRADESVRPAQASDILAASSVAAEPLVNFLKGPWVINPRDKVTGVLHPPKLPSGPTGVKRIPYCRHSRAAKEPHPMGEASPMFIPTFNHSLHIAARPDRLSADGGGVLLREVLEQSGIIEWLMAHLVATRAQDQIDYPLAELLRTVLVLYGQGWRDQDDADALRFDPVLRVAISEAAGTAALDEGQHLPSQPTLSRLLKMLSQPARAAKRGGRDGRSPVTDR